MNARIGLGFALVAVLAAGCSAADGDATSSGGSDRAVASSAAELSVGAYNCATLTVASFGATSDLYVPTNASSPSTLYAFLNAAIAQSTQDVAHAGSHDYSNEAHQTLAALQSAQTELSTNLEWMTSQGLSGSNASASYSMGTVMNGMITNLALAASLASISAIGNYPNPSGTNAASYAELYSRKALEIANQTGYHFDYCYESPYGRQVANAGSFPSMACSSVP